MKILKLVLCLWMSFFTVVNLNGQCTHVDDDVFVSGQQQLSNFVQTYGSCDTLFFTVHFRNLISFTGLENVKHIEGDVYIEKCPLLKNLNGLQHLESISGKIDINNNDSLLNISALDMINQVGSFYLRDLPSLTHLPEFPNLIEIQIIWVYNLSSLHGFDSFKNLVNARSIHFDDCDSLISVQFPTSIQEIGDLWISYCPISHAIELDNIQMEDLHIASTRILEIDCTGMPQDMGRIIIHGNSLLEKLTGFENVEKLESLRISQNGDGFGVLVFDAFENLDTVTQDLTFTHNRYVTEDLSFYSHVNHIGDELIIVGTDDLTTLDDLWPLAYSVQGEITIQNNDILEDCDMLCPHLEAGRPLFIKDNIGLCTDLESLMQLCGSVNTFDAKNNSSKYVYPNPFTDVLYFSDDISGQYHLYNAFGDVVKFGELTSEINVSQLIPGSYYIQLNTSKGDTIIQKLVKT